MAASGNFTEEYFLMGILSDDLSMLGVKRAEKSRKTNGC